MCRRSRSALIKTAANLETQKDWLNHFLCPFEHNVPKFTNTLLSLSLSLFHLRVHLSRFHDTLHFRRPKWVLCTVSFACPLFPFAFLSRRWRRVWSSSALRPLPRSDRERTSHSSAVWTPSGRVCRRAEGDEVFNLSGDLHEWWASLRIALQAHLSWQLRLRMAETRSNLSGLQEEAQTVADTSTRRIARRWAVRLVRAVLLCLLTVE
jgi:hypothetical protein